MIET
jgi:hypothetical protein